MEKSKDKDGHNNLLLKNIKSIYITKLIFYNLPQKFLLKLIKYNKNLQKILNIGINDYKTYNDIEIEIIPINIDDLYKVINIPIEYRKYYHIYWNDNYKNEIGTNYITEYDNIQKIKIAIEPKIKSFKNLFKDCSYIEKINFIKYNRKDINDMSGMFSYCSSLKEINFNNFNANNVIDMNHMFIGCTSLQKLNLNKNINTKNADKIHLMYKGAKDELKMELRNHIENTTKKEIKKKNLKRVFLCLYSIIITIIFLYIRFKWINLLKYLPNY